MNDREAVIITKYILFLNHTEQMLNNAGGIFGKVINYKDMNHTRIMYRSE